MVGIVKHIAVTGLLFLFCLAAESKAQDVKVGVKLDTGAILIGDHVGMKLNFSGPSGARVDWPVFGDTILGNIVVIGRSKLDSSFSQDRKTLTISQELNLTSFDSGFYTIPQIPFRYRLMPDTSLRTALSGLTMLMVHTVKVDTTQAIKPIKSPLSVPISFREILPYLIGAVLLAALVWLGIWYYRKRKRKEPLLPARPGIVLRPHEKAMQALEKLRVKKLWQQGQVKEYYSELTDILRLYIEEGFGIPAMESTTWEINEDLKNRGGFPKETIGRLFSLLSLADMVKFAKSEPLPADNEDSMNAGIDFVRSTLASAVTGPMPGSEENNNPPVK
jgi:hypothetical protein